MTPRHGFKKITKVRNVPGGKDIETRWRPDNTGCVVGAVILFLLFMFVRGC
jgi:hypothetical protein